MRGKLSTESQSQGAGSRMKYNNSWTVTSCQFLVLIQLNMKGEQEIPSQDTGKGTKNQDKQRSNTKVTNASKIQGREGNCLEEIATIQGLHTSHRTKKIRIASLGLRMSQKY